MNPTIAHIYETLLVEDADGNRIDPFPTSLTRDRALPLYHLIRKTGARKTLEVGMAYGLSTLFMCQAHQDNGGGDHTAIDPFQRSLYKSIGLLNVQRAGLDRLLRFYEATSQQALPRLLEQQEQFDCIFIDGSHLFDDAFVDFYYADKLLRHGGYLAIDDIWTPGVLKMCGFVLRNRCYQLAPEFIVQRIGVGARLKALLKDVRRDPIDWHTICCSAQLAWNGFWGFCVLQKLEEGRRHWDHYRGF